MKIIDLIKDIFTTDKLQKAISLKNQISENIEKASKLNSEYLEDKSMLLNYISVLNNKVEIAKSENKDFNDNIGLINRISEKLNLLENDFSKSIISLVNENVILTNKLDDIKKDQKLKKALEQNEINEAYSSILEAYKNKMIEKKLFKEARKKMEEKTGNTVMYSDMIVCNSKGEILLLQRSKNSEKFPEQWCLPGGHVDPNEEHKEASIRELEEETSIKVTEEVVSKVVDLKKDNAHIEYFRVWCEEPIICIDTDEHELYEWVKPENLVNYDLIADLKEVLDKLYNYEYVVEIKKSFEVLEKAFKAGLVDEEIYTQGLSKYNDYLEKSKGGIYKDNPENRRLKRVGKRYGELGKEEDKGKGSIKEEDKDGKILSLEDYAKQSSDEELERASKGDNEELRIAAKKEIERRGSEHKESNKENNNDFNVSKEGNKVIIKNKTGELTADIKGDRLMVFSAAINTEFRKKGYGKLLYEKAIEVAKENNLDLGSYYTLSEDSLGVWKSLEKKYKVERNPKAKIYSEEFKKRGIELPKGVPDMASTNDPNESVFILKTKNDIFKSDKISIVMNEFSEGKLKDSHGKIVTDKDQALAIAYSEAELNKNTTYKKFGRK